MRQADANPEVLATVLAGLFPDTRHPSFHRTAEGVSTPVYRVSVGDRTYYLRLAESPEASLTPEAEVHRLLALRAVHLPEIIAFDPCHPLLGRSLMVTSAIAGMPMDERLTPAQRRTILIAAGRDLAKINSVPVAGFGWINRTSAESRQLRAEYPDWQAFVVATLDDHLDRLGRVGVLKSGAVGRIKSLFSACEGREGLDQSAWLAHGDFDTTHIFHTGGQYSGIIDFGEIRGADRLYDLGHFLLHDGERIPQQLFPHLLAGYQELIPLLPDHKKRIRRIAIMIGVSGLGRLMQRRPQDYRSAPLYQWLVRKLPVLLEGERIGT